MKRLGLKGTFGKIGLINRRVRMSVKLEMPDLKYWESYERVFGRIELEGSVIDTGAELRAKFEAD